jgi:hypothetical protein
MEFQTFGSFEDEISFRELLSLRDENLTDNKNKKISF